MKKLIFPFIVVVTMLMVTSCDYVKNPIPVVNVNLEDTTTCPAPDGLFPALPSTTLKKILIEDYTAHRCPNCPRAARKLHQIDTTYHDRIIGVAVHAGGLADPSPTWYSAFPGSYSSDFKTTVGTEYDNIFGASALGLPEGTINRKYSGTDSTYLKQDPNWASFVASIINEPADVAIQLHVDYDNSTRKLCCAVKASYLNNLSGNYNLVVLIIQDSIVDWQDQPDGSHMQFYTHNHMLRDAITPSGAWGETLVAGSALAGTTNTKRYAYKIPGDYKNITCDPHHCSIVAYIYKKDVGPGRYEIIQSEEVKVIP